MTTGLGTYAAILRKAAKQVRDTRAALRKHGETCDTCSDGKVPVFGTNGRTVSYMDTCPLFERGSA